MLRRVCGLSFDHFDVFENHLDSLLAHMSDVALDFVSLDLMSADAVGLHSGRRAAFSTALGSTSSAALRTALSALGSTSSAALSALGSTSSTALSAL